MKKNYRNRKEFLDSLMQAEYEEKRRRLEREHRMRLRILEFRRKFEEYVFNLHKGGK